MRWKWIIGIVVGLIIAVVIALYIIISSYDFNSLKPQITRLAKEATGRELKLEGDIKLKISLRPALVVEGVRFQNAPWGSRPDMAQIKRFEVQVALLPLLSKNIELSRLILMEPDILVETDRAGKSNLEFEKKPVAEKPKEAPPPKGEMKLPALTIKEFRIVKGLVTYKDGKTGKTYAVGLESLNAAIPGLESPMKLQVRGDYNKEPFEVDGSLGPIAAFTKPGTPWPLNVTAKIVSAVLTIDGSIKDVKTQRGMDLKLGLKGKELADFGKLTGKPLPVKGAYDISGRITDVAPKAYKVSDLKVNLGESDLSGSMEANLAGSRPIISAALSSKKMDVRSLMGAGGEVAKSGKEPPKAGAKRERMFPSDALPLEGLNQVDAAVKYRAAQVLLPKLALNDLSVDLNLKNGRLVIRPFKALVGGGALDGFVDLDSEGKVAALTTLIKIDKLDLGKMLKDLQINETVEGNLDVEMDLRGRGASVAGIMGELNGKTVVVMGKGKISNKYLELLSGDLSSNIFKLVNPAQKETQQTVVNCFVSGFSIKNGQAETTALVFDTERMSVVGDGEIDLKTEKLNIGLKPSPKESAGTGTAGKIQQSLTDLAKPFRLAGTLANPSLAVDPTQAAVTATQIAESFGFLGKKGASAAPAGTAASTDLCAPAIEAAKKGVKMGSATPAAGQEKKGTAESPLSPKGSLKDLGKGLKKLFGK
jgi:uncharacterized protein involved in outer membrane biogenesis